MTPKSAAPQNVDVRAGRTELKKLWGQGWTPKTGLANLDLVAIGDEVRARWERIIAQ